MDAMPHAMRPASPQEMSDAIARESEGQPDKGPDSLTAARCSPRRLPTRLHLADQSTPANCIDAPHTARAQRRFQAWSDSRQAGRQARAAVRCAVRVS